ncbi:MAG: cbb3-type cytochrome c oxidase subunit I [Nitrospinae bacterium]|nr:cbb3-type cytochrome c oxidase subunit I [Nitrospinota bacterium]
MRNSYTGKWFMLSILSLGLGGSFAFLVGMSRAPFVEKYLPHDYFQHALVGHVNLAILFWLLLSTVVMWSAHFKTPGLKTAFYLALAGTALVAFAALFGSGDAVLNNYVPALVNPFFFAGLALFFAGFSANVFRFSKEAFAGLSSDDMVKNALSAGVCIGLVLIGAVVASLLLLGGDISVYHQQVYYERLFWTPGHIQQFLNGSMLVAVWYALAKVALGVEAKFWPFLKSANKALIISASLLLVLLFFFDPLDKPLRVGAEIIYGIGLGIPLFLHIGNIVRQLWGAKLDFKNPPVVALVFSMSIYLFGILIAYAGFNNDTRVPAHYHGAVTALTLALMGFAYNALKTDRLRIFFNKVATAQPYIYGVGMLIFITGLFVSGFFGAPRKTPGVEYTQNPVVIASMGLMGIGTLCAVIGGAAFVWYVCVTLYKDQPAENP